MESWDGIDILTLKRKCLRIIWKVKDQSIFVPQVDFWQLLVNLWNPVAVNCQLLTCISTSSSGHKSLPSGHSFVIKTSPARPGKQILIIQTIFKAARSFLCHKMSGEQILFYQGSPILRLGDEFARCGWLGQINQIETPADDQCDTDKGKSNWKYLLISSRPLKIIDISSDLFLLEITPKRWRWKLV